MRAISLLVEGTTVDIEHDGVSTITIYGEPIAESIDYIPDQRAQKLLDKKGMDILQSIDMMDFEANVAMLLRASLKSKQLAVPLQRGEYSVEINITSSRSTAEVPLIHVLKSVIDGINKDIVGNDVTIYEATIRYAPSNPRARVYPSRPTDNLSVQLYSIVAGVRSHVAGFDDVPMHVVPKMSPTVLDEEHQRAWWVYNEELRAEAVAALIQDGMQQICNTTTKRVHMTFIGGKVSKLDLDNMARACYPILTSIGLLDETVHELQLVKQICGNHQRSQACIVVQ